MKKIIIPIFLTVLLFSCNNFENIKKEDICGKRFTSSIPSSISQGVSYDSGTTLKCDGTFESGHVVRMRGQNTRDLSYYTGTWEIINQIPDEVRNAVIKFGLDHKNYSIIKYTSSNGITDYCVYYPNSYNGTPTLATLNIYSHPDNAGIHDGFLEK